MPRLSSFGSPFFQKKNASRCRSTGKEPEAHYGASEANRKYSNRLLDDSEAPPRCVQEGWRWGCCHLPLGDSKRLVVLLFFCFFFGRRIQFLYICEPCFCVCVLTSVLFFKAWEIHCYHYTVSFSILCLKHIMVKICRSHSYNVSDRFRTTTSEHTHYAIVSSSCEQLVVKAHSAHQ